MASYLLVLLFTWMSHCSSMWKVTLALEEVLLDTRTATSDVGWTMAHGSEWQEVSSTHPDGGEMRMLMVCQIKSREKQNNWVRTPYIPVHGAKRVYVEFEFTMRSCEDVANVATCKETFNLYYYETDRDEATSTFPPWEEGAYKKVDTIAADRRFRPGSQETNFETRDIGPVTSNGLYVALQDTGSCMAVMHIRVYYKFCIPTSQNLAQFPRTISGPERTSLVERAGTCVDNAFYESGVSAILHCNSDGEWTVSKGRCLCGPGFEPDFTQTSCEACGRGLFKPFGGNGPCRRCPAYSHSVGYSSKVCDCMFGYFRSLSDDVNAPCTKPPSKPLNLMATVNQSRVTLSWTRPANDGGRDDLVYRIECSRCESRFTACTSCSSELSYHPSRNGLTFNSALVQGLSPLSYYKFDVYAENGVSKLSDKIRNLSYASVTVETLASGPLKILATVDVDVVAMGTLRVSWSVLDQFAGLAMQYDVKVTDGLTMDEVHMNGTTQRSMLITGLNGERAYAVQVRVRCKFGVEPFGGSIIVTPWVPEATKDTPPADRRKEESVNTIWILVAAIVGLVIVLLILVFACYCKRRNKQRREKDTEGEFEKLRMFSCESSLHGGNHLSVLKTYVDPSTYEDPRRAVHAFTKQIDASCVTIQAVIGAGEFGEVYRGHLKLLPSKKERDVAIKTLKIGYSSQQKLDFLGEASVMGQFDHPNVIRLEGVVTKSRPLMIITEYMENGSLDAYLRNHDGELSVIQLVGMLRDIAAGMKYLSDMGYVHRDLAARNILVDAQLICKVSDFGMSRILEEEEDSITYESSGGKIPIRWTAPEAITYRKFTSASDVWSYGIVMWEVMSYGERPYWEMPNRDVIHAVETGFRLPAPMECPRMLHHLMLECWKKNRNERPRFSHAVMSLDRMLNDPSQLKAVASQSEHMNGRLVTSRGSVIDFPLYYPEKEKLPAPFVDAHSACGVPFSAFNGVSSNLASVEKWLDVNGFSEYKDNFIENGCANLEKVVQLKPKDLSKLGITNINHQNALLDSIYSMKFSTEYRKSDPPQYQDDRVTGVPV